MDQYVCHCTDTAPEESCGSSSGERNMCYIEKSFMDPEGDEFCSTNDRVWMKVKPPPFSEVLNQPLVSARQIEVLRAKLSGKIGTREMAKNKPKVPPEKKKIARQFISSTKMMEIER